MSDENPAEHGGRSDSGDSLDRYWHNKRDSRGSLTSIAEADLARGHFPSRIPNRTKADAAFWDDYYAERRDSRPSLADDVGHDMFNGRPAFQRRSFEEEVARKHRYDDYQGPSPELIAGSESSVVALLFLDTSLRNVLILTTLVVFDQSSTEHRPYKAGSVVSPSASIDSFGNHPFRSGRTAPPQASHSQRVKSHSVKEGKRKASVRSVGTDLANQQPSSAAEEQKSPLLQRVRSVWGKRAESSAGKGRLGGQ